MKMSENEKIAQALIEIRYVLFDIKELLEEINEKLGEKDIGSFSDNIVALYINQNINTVLTLGGHL